MDAYDAGFFETQISESRDSAQAVVPVLLDLFPHVRTVLDVGGGAGAWAATWLAAGTDALCVDGDYISADQFVVPADHFRAHDLTEPLDLGRRFDLVTCLEVAEHLDAPDAETLVASLARHGDLIVFSAAIPGQGGQHHVNEQWPSHWRPIFDGLGFEAFDVLRPRLWARSEVGFWFRQNLLVYARGDAAKLVRALPQVPFPLDIVHPEQFALKVRLAADEPPIRVAAGQVVRGLKRRLATGTRRRA